MNAFEYLNATDLEMLQEALARLRETKVQAHAEIVKVPGHERFTLRDFGVPQLDALIARVDKALDTADAKG